MGSSKGSSRSSSSHSLAPTCSSTVASNRPQGPQQPRLHSQEATSQHLAQAPFTSFPPKHVQGEWRLPSSDPEESIGFSTAWIPQATSVSQEGVGVPTFPRQSYSSSPPLGAATMSSTRKNRLRPSPAGLHENSQAQSGVAFADSSQPNYSTPSSSRLRPHVEEDIETIRNSRPSECECYRCDACRTNESDQVGLSQRDVSTSGSFPASRTRSNANNDRGWFPPNEPRTRIDAHLEAQHQGSLARSAQAQTGKAYEHDSEAIDLLPGERSRAGTPNVNRNEDEIRRGKRERVKDALGHVSRLWKHEHGSRQGEGARKRERDSDSEVEHIIVQHWTENC